MGTKFCFLIVSALVFALTAQAQAEILAIDDITTSPAAGGAVTDPDGDGRYERDATLTSITVDGTTYTQLAGPTSVVINSGATWAIPADESTTGQTELDAVSGLQVTSGLINGSRVEFYFLGLITLDSKIMLFENDLANGELVNFYAIDATGTRLASASGNPVNFLSLLDPDPAAVITVDMIQENGSSIGSRNIEGFVFTLRDLGIDESDFGPGELATLAGLELSSSSWDVHMAGLVIPEPASVALALLSATMAMSRRTRRMS